jgi:hypothetical protein
MLNGDISQEFKPLRAQSPRRKHPEDQSDVNSGDRANAAVRSKQHF